MSGTEFAGTLRERVLIEQPISTRNAMGLQEPGWETVCSCLASVSLESVGAESEAQALSAMPKYRVTIRTRDGIALDQRVTWNARKKDYRHYCCHPHPINFNLGKIAGGDWASSVPAWCHFDMRVAVYPGQSLASARAEIEAFIAAAAARDPFLAKHPPRVIYHGFMAEGYVLENGEMAMSGPARELLESDVVQEAYLGA